MELNRARELAENIKQELAPLCHRIEVAGSIRRGKPDVHDIDIVCIPISQAFYSMLGRLGNVSGGPKIYKVEVFGDEGKIIISQGKPFCADIYIATEATWATMMLIRTGSAQHNIRLCKLAQSKGMKLHADGSGLEKVPNFTYESVLFCSPLAQIPELIPCPTETAIFEALGLPYKAAAERE